MPSVRERSQTSAYAYRRTTDVFDRQRDCRAAGGQSIVRTDFRYHVSEALLPVPKVQKTEIFLFKPLSYFSKMCF